MYAGGSEAHGRAGRQQRGVGRGRPVGVLHVCRVGYTRGASCQVHNPIHLFIHRPREMFREFHKRKRNSFVVLI